MYKLLCLNKISTVGTDRLGDKYGFSSDMKEPDGILVRSASMHETALPESLLAIARAGAGVNNIPIEKCTQKGIAVFNTPGANANAVKELVLCALMLSSRKIVPAIDWVKSLGGEGEEISRLVEKGKSAFAGPEIAGKSLGVVGLGAIGILVANAAEQLGMTVYGYDPFLSVEAAWRLSSGVKRSASFDEICRQCDYITLHLPETEDTRGMINAESISKMKDGARLLNFARGGLVVSDDIIKAAAGGRLSAYVTDFPAEGMSQAENIIALPHLGASTPESEDNCAAMAVDEIKDYLECGNVKNSVNIPAVSMPREPGTDRICAIHRNLPNTIAVFTAVCGKVGINIENMQSKSRGEIAYTILDVSGDVPQSAVEALKALEPVIRVRVIRY